jgi:Raf kinase inhibitor-like YbhB/YbcL family protein
VKVTQTITLAAGLMTLTVIPVFAQQAAANNPAAPPRRPPLVLTSTAFQDSTPIPEKYTCSAKGTPVSIPLAWTEPRQGTVSFALLFHDLEAVMHKSTEDVTHWMTWNIPADLRGLPEGFPPVPADLADGMRQGINSPGKTGYFGPCAGPGLPHHYIFELFALDTKLALPLDASRSDFEKALDGHIVGHATLVGLFHQ